MSAQDFLAGASSFFGYLLPIAGVVVLVYLAILFKKAVETLKEVDRTLIIVEEQVRKLDAPLETVENVSKSVDDVNTKAREAASSASKSIAEGTAKVKSWLDEKKSDGSIDENVASIKKNVGDAAESVKETVSQAGDFVADRILEKKSDLKEFPIYHGQEEE